MNMKWVDRYIYDVTRRLPDSMRAEVKMELENQIFDMLDGKNDEKSIKRVLEELGNPRLLANGYRGKERYLISPAYFDSYIHVLKIVLIILAIVGFIGGAIEGAVETYSRPWYEMMGSIISGGIGNMISAMFSGFAMVTLIYVVLDYQKVNLEKEPWNLDKLPELPKFPNAKISRTSTTVSLIFETTFSVLFVLLLIRYIDVLGWYDGNTIVAPFFHSSTIDVFLPFLIATIVVSVVVHAVMIYQGFWSKGLVLFFTFSQLFSLVIGVVFITHPHLIHAGFIDQFGLALDGDLSLARQIVQIIKSILVAVVVIAASLELGSVWYRFIRSGGLKK